MKILENLEYKNVETEANFLSYDNFLNIGPIFNFELGKCSGKRKLSRKRKKKKILKSTNIHSVGPMKQEIYSSWPYCLFIKLHE